MDTPIVDLLESNLYIKSNVLKFIENFKVNQNKYIIADKLKCVLFKREDNELFVFDKNNKIRVIIPKCIILDKINSSSNYLDAIQLINSKVILYKPTIDIKIVLDNIKNKFFITCILTCENYEFLDSFDKTLEHYKDIPYIDNIKELNKFFSENYQQFLILFQQFNDKFCKDYFVLNGSFALDDILSVLLFSQISLSQTLNSKNYFKIK